MRIIKCNINNFGCYSDKEFNFSSSLNPFCINNGEGKTTLAQFIKAMLYSLEKSKSTSYERKHYKPYSGGTYGGSMVISFEGKVYRIERTFFDSASKDILKIYDEEGNLLSNFKGQEISSLQGENSSLLGELILGFDVNTFTKVNFISSNDLDFSSSESLKMKLGNIVLNKDKENSLEETLKLINDDLRDKAPTARRNEKAYKYQITSLKKANKEKTSEIEEIKKLDTSLDELYLKRDAAKEELNKIEIEQNNLNLLNVKKGKYEALKTYDEDKQKEEENISNLNIKYQNNLFSQEEIKLLNSYLDEYNKENNIASGFVLTPYEINKLNDLENNLILESDYNVLFTSYNKLNAIDTSSIIKIDEDEFSSLKNKFLGKDIIDEETLSKDIYEYNNLLSRDKESFFETKDFPSSNVIEYMKREIKTLNELNLTLSNLKSSYKEPAFIIRFILSIFTLGIYFIFLNTKRKKFNLEKNSLEEQISETKKELDTFFNKYHLEFGTYEGKMNDLEDQISKYESTKNNNELKSEKLNELINEKKTSLLSYFAYFGYINLDISEAYNQYKIDFSRYNKLIEEAKRNEEILNNINKKQTEIISLIQPILDRYNLVLNDNFSSTLESLKADLDFYKLKNPIYLNKLGKEKIISEIKTKMINILNQHDINEGVDLILTTKNVILDMEKYNTSLTNINILTKKKNDYIKENSLEDFNLIEADIKDEELRTNHKQKSDELRSIEDKINEIETRINKKETLLEEIESNKNLISNYEQKVKIAEIALKSLKEASSDMERKFISPIKDSFINYASKIYEKISSNVTMNYDYEIQYEIKGELRDSRDLSEGERTIMMLSLRFAVLDSLYKDHDSVIILDDPFEALDKDKVSKAIEVIKELSSSWQIIYFTCHETRKIA